MSPTRYQRRPLSRRGRCRRRPAAVRVGRDPRQVRDRMKELRRQHEDGQALADARLTVGAYLTSWLEEVGAARARVSQPTRSTTIGG
jgi:hypothetical protein